MKSPLRWFRLPSAAWVLLVAALFGLHVRRALTIPVTHDEALTYLRYVTGSWGGVIGHFDSNNHVLQTVLCKAIVGVFGVSVGTLRAAALLGALLFLIAWARIAVVVAGGGLGSVVLFGLAASNPLVVRQLSLARGYSLALAFFGVGLLALIPEGISILRRRRADGPERKVHPAVAAIAFSLSVAANLTLLFPCVGAAAAAIGLAWYSPKGERAGFRRWLRYGLPAACLAVAFLSVPVVHAVRRSLARRSEAKAPAAGILESAQKANYYLGELSTSGSLHALLGGSLGPAGATRAAVFLSALAGTAMAIFLVFGIRRYRGAARRLRARLRTRSTTAVLLAGSLFGSVAILAALHAAIGLPLPQARTGLPFLVLSPFAWAASILLLPRRARRAGSLLSALAGAALLIQFFRVSSRSDLIVPDSERMIEMLRGVSRGTTTPWRVSASWFAAPSLELYRRLDRADEIAPFEYRDPLCLAGADAAVLMGKDRISSSAGGFDEIFRDPRSGAEVVVSRRNAGMNAPCPPARLAERWSP